MGPVPAGSPGTHRWPRKAALAAATTVLLLGALELVLRATTHEVGLWSVSAQSVRDHLERDAMRYDPYLGWVRRDLPNPALGINADGFRHPEVARNKPAGTWRAFALGDSQTYGAGVDAEQAWPSQAEAALRRRAPGAQIELINAGISGYTSRQALRLTTRVLLDWQPDALIIDCRTRDSLRDPGLSADLGNDLLPRLTFHWRTLWVLRFLIERATGHGARQMHLGELQRDEPVLASEFGNHDLIMALAARESLQVLFVDYPFWEHDGIGCLAPSDELPPGAVSAPACIELQAAGLPAEQLFLDNNHLTVEGNRRVGETVADSILDQGWIGR